MTKELNSWTEAPVGAMQLYNQHYRNMQLSWLSHAIDFDNQWKPYGYNNILFARDISTIFLTK